MHALVRLVWCLVLAICADVVTDRSHAEDGQAHLEHQLAASTARQAREAERARVARQRWEQERRRSAAHARMPDTMYASTPSAPAVELSCPVVTDDGVRRAVQGWGDEVSSSPYFSEDLLAARNGGVFPAPPLQGMVGGFGSSGDDASVESVPHDAWSAAVATASNVADTPHLVPLFPSASDAALQGFVRVINHSGDAGEVQIDAVDDTGVSYGPLTLSIDGATTVHFNSNDLEGGNTGKGLTGSTGAGEGDWRLTLTSDLDIEVLSYIRTTDGFLTAMHDLAPVAEGEHRIAIFNPGSNAAQVSRLRLINPGEAEAQVTIEGVDDRGASPDSAVQVNVAAGATQTLTAAELESGGTGMTGALGDGAGKWQLTVKSEAPIHALSLLSSPTGHLTNLSTAPSNLLDGVHAVALFPSASDASGRQGFVRVINRSESPAEITIGAHDETDWTYEPLTLSLQGGQVAHFNSNDLEQGNAGKGLTGSTGAGEGDWRLELSSDADIEVLSYIRTTDGFLTAMHDVAPVSGTRHRVAIFNPGSNMAQVSRLRLVNAGQDAAEVMIVGTDDGGLSPGSDVLVTVPAGGTRTYTAQELESGAEGLEGSLGDGAGKWRLEVTSDVRIRVLSLLSSPTGHLTNLSTATARGNVMQTAEEVFGTLISPIMQSQCVNCHMDGGVSGNTRVVFVTDDDTDHVAKNFSVFETFLAEVEDGADYILNKVQGVGHGGGIQLAAGTDEFSHMERFLGLLEGEEVGPVAITPANLFDGVQTASRRNILRRAAITFAGRIPTDEEYESIRGTGAVEFRTAIRNLMQGPEFHEFLIRASNDRLFTDRELDRGWIIENNGHFVDFDNKVYELQVDAIDRMNDQEFWGWVHRVQFGVGRAPLELIAHVVENDLPYTTVLTADYIMANPMAAEAYGAATAFGISYDPSDFEPSRIERYYRIGEGHVAEYDPEVDRVRVLDPGPLITDYPHAGLLNTTVFLLRYPTTATNRNRARSRWMYYHFLGVDIEKSASRTTDPVALADTNNPTLHNPACTVCHSVLDPVAGAFQNYGDEGLYRDKWGGMDSLDDYYKEGWASARGDFEITAGSYAEAQTIALTAWLKPGGEVLRLAPDLDPPPDDSLELWWHMGIDTVSVTNADGQEAVFVEAELLGLECGSEDPVVDEISGDQYYEAWFCDQEISIEVPVEGHYRVAASLWKEHQHEDVDDRRRIVTMSLGGYQEGDAWYRDMRDPGFDQERVPDAKRGLRWLADRIVDDSRFAEAAVRFWWPPIMGAEILETPEAGDDADFEALLLSSSAQALEVERLGRGFRQGFRGGAAYNPKDLLVEIVLSKWFRAYSFEDAEPVRAKALAGAGASRLLTPEELARKTLALTGFQWGREREGREPWRLVHEQGLSALTDTAGYRLLYGGIDSDGVTDRSEDISSVMAGVARAHALETGCPVVMKEFYLVEEEDRQLFSSVDEGVSPIFEFGDSFEVQATSADGKEKLSLGGRLSSGSAVVSLSFVNDYGDNAGDRNLRLDRLDLRDSDGRVVFTQQLEELEAVSDCNGPVGDHFALHCSGSVDVPVDIPAGGYYDVEVITWADQAGDELAKVWIVVGSDAERSAGSRAIKDELVELYERLHGVRVVVDSAEIKSAYGLFVDAWDRKRRGGNHFLWNDQDLACDWPRDHYFFDGIADHLWLDEVDEDGKALGWDWERVSEYLEETDFSDPHGVARTWVVVLAYLMMDYRYLYL